MGACASAHLAYGYDLGNNDGFFCAERDRYGAPTMPWYDDESEDDFEGQAEHRLLTLAGFDFTRTDDYYERLGEAVKDLGVEIYHSGHVDYSGWMLVASGSVRTVYWAESLKVEPNELINTPVHRNWNTLLASAVKALGITPDTTSPKWLVFPSYG